MKTTPKLFTGSLGMIILLTLGFYLFTAFTVPTVKGKAKLALDLRSYFDQNIKPEMQPQRTKLDQLLSADEKKEIKQLNARVCRLISERNAAGIGFINSDEFSFRSIPVFTDQQKNKQKESHDELRRIMAQAWIIADRHEEEISQLLKEKSGHYDTWEAGVTDIIKNFLDDKFLFIGGKQIIKRIENRGTIKYYSPVVFLLWDPQQRFISDELIKN